MGMAVAVATGVSSPKIKIGLLTLDSTNEMYAAQCAAQSGDLVIAAAKLDSLTRAEADAILYDFDHLKMFGDPVSLVVPGSARLQVAFSYNFTRGEVRTLRRRGIIVCRRLSTAVRLVAGCSAAAPRAPDLNRESPTGVCPIGGGVSDVRTHF